MPARFCIKRMQCGQFCVASVELMPSNLPKKLDSKIWHTWVWLSMLIYAKTVGKDTPDNTNKRCITVSIQAIICFRRPQTKIWHYKS
jgi:hypothetical protein